MRMTSAADLVAEDDQPMLLINSSVELVWLVESQEFDWKPNTAGVQHPQVIAATMD